MLLSFDPGIVNLGYVAMDIADKTISFAGVLNIKASAHIDIIKKLNINLSELVTKITLNGTLDKVIIERQIGRNAKMRQIETSIATFFLTLNTLEILNCDIIIYSAILKFNIPIEGFTFTSDLSGRKKYRVRKKEVQSCVKFLYDTEYNFDISDSILQAYCYLLKREIGQ